MLVGMITSSRRSFLKQAGLSTLGFWLPPSTGVAKTSAGLPRSTPEAEGMAASGILDFLAAVEREAFELHSLMVLRHGKVVAEGWWEPYGPEFVHTMYSMSKSFTSTAVGFAVAEGKMSVEDKVVSFFPDDLPATVSENLAAMRVRDLLTMSTGNEKEPTQVVVKSENWVRTFLAQNFAHTPGTQFMYNSAATYMCSAIVQKVTGQNILDYLTPRLFEPLGIAGMRWENCPRGIATGGWGLSIQTEGLAKFGQLFLQKGMWQGKQLIPAAWVEEATRKHIQQPGGDKPDRPKAQNDWLQGYGYQIWRCQGTAFRGDGAFGQFTIVLPEQDAVIVMTSENKNMQGQLDLVWKHLLPAFGAKTAATGDLEPLKHLKLPLPAGSKTSPQAKSARFQLAGNELGLTEVGFEFGDETCTLVAGTNRIVCGLSGWHRTEGAFPGTPPRLISGGAPKTTATSKIAAHATWTDEQTLQLTWRYYETPHRDTLTCRFEGDKLTVTFLNSITAMNPKAKDSRAALQGTRM
jgi:CubicO group peptidase (beta-lactamase class C family)